LSSRRHSTLRRIAATATELPKSLELEARIARLELLVKGLREDLAARQRNEAALQAQLDHLAARLREERL
jgi:uncharacterized coiled-coil protein SlyX